MKRSKKAKAMSKKHEAKEEKLIDKLESMHKKPKMGKKGKKK